MTISEAISRGYNFFVVATLALLAGSMIGEVGQETEWLFRIDELAIIAIGVIAVVWYRLGRNRLTLSLAPLLLAILAFAAKLFGLIVEIKEPDDVGDDIGIVQMLLLFVIVTAVAYMIARREIRQIEANKVGSQLPPQATYQR